MTPKEKAKDLVDKFLKFQTYTVGFEVDDNAKFTILQRAKQCALIAVDEIIFEARWQLNYGYEKRIKYWSEVKNEIEKL